MVKLYVVNTIATAENVAAFIHDKLSTFHGKYSADNYAVLGKGIFKHKSKELYGIVLPKAVGKRWKNIKDRLPPAFDKTKILDIEKTNPSWFTKE